MIRRYGRAVAGELVHPLVRATIWEAASSDSTIGKITDAFRDHGFTPKSGPGVVESDECIWMGKPSRRSVFTAHAEEVDWSDPRQARRGLDALGAILDDVRGEDRARVLQRLQRHGVECDDVGHLSLTGSAIAAEVSLDALDDPEAVLEQLERLRRGGTHDDPPAAVSAAKALVEAACKQVLPQLGEAVDDQIKMHKLIETTHQALAPDAEAIPSSADRRQTTVNILKNLAHIPIGLAELRNAYGPDHGRLAPTIGLHQRHADLAVGAASTYVNFLLATLAERTRART